MGKEYHIKLSGELITVNEEVYRAYQQPLWREKKRAEVRRAKEISLDAMLEDGHSIEDEALVDEIVADKLLLDELLSALAELTDDERFLINGLYFENQTVREYSNRKGTNHTSIVRQHKRILEKLRNILKINL